MAAGSSIGLAPVDIIIGTGLQWKTSVDSGQDIPSLQQCQRMQGKIIGINPNPGSWIQGLCQVLYLS
jgi:hypothetical protein